MKYLPSAKERGTVLKAASFMWQPASQDPGPHGSGERALRAIVEAALLPPGCKGYTVSEMEGFMRAAMTARGVLD